MVTSTQNSAQARIRQDGDEDSRPHAADPTRERLIATLPVTERTLPLAGISTTVLEGGDGEPLILLHGPGEFAAVWTRVIPDLVTTHRVIAPDLPGHGATELPAASLSADRLVAWMDALIERTCTSAPILVGHVLGGAIATRYAIARQDRLSGLVLVDSMGLAPFRPSLGFALAMAGFVARPTERSQERLFRGCFVDFDAVRDQMGEEWPPLAAYALERARTPELQAALRKLMPQFALKSIPSGDLARLDLPTTLIWGRHDLQVRLAVAEAASVRYGWPLHVIENAADDPAVEQPAAFLSALRGAVAARAPRQETR